MWFALKYFGHKKVSVLDGGMKKWLKENRPTSKRIEKNSVKFNILNKYKAYENTELIKNKKQIDDNIKNFSFQTVDARSRDRFLGKVNEPRPELKKGCILGSKKLCIFFSRRTTTARFFLKGYLVEEDPSSVFIV